MNFDFESLTLEEVETIENLTDLAIDDAFGNGKPKGKVLRVFIWVMLRRTNPSFSMDEAKKYTLKQALDMVQGDEAKKE